jgi:hypothetical protein
VPLYTEIAVPYGNVGWVGYRMGSAYFKRMRFLRIRNIVFMLLAVLPDLFGSRAARCAMRYMS